MSQPNILRLVLVKLAINLLVQLASTHFFLIESIVQRFMDGRYTPMILQKLPLTRCCKVITMSFRELDNLHFHDFLKLTIALHISRTWPFIRFFLFLLCSVKPSEFWTFLSSLNPCFQHRIFPYQYHILIQIFLFKFDVPSYAKTRQLSIASVEFFLFG